MGYVRINVLVASMKLLTVLFPNILKETLVILFFIVMGPFSVEISLYVGRIQEKAFIV